jgi:protocatechuate 3,4-dioxygenase beta subunit
MNGQGSAYGSGLVKVAELATQAPPSIALGIFESKQQVARRLKRILDPTCPVGRKLSVSSLLSIVAIAAILIPSAAKPTAEVEVSQNAPVERQQEVDDESTDSAEKEELRNYLAAIPEKDRVTVTGLVTDESGEPIAKSSVKLRPNWLGVTLRTNTDADGMYSLSGNRNHMRAAFVEASGSEGELLGASRLPWDASQVGLEPIDVELKSPKIVSSVVLDDNELPVSGATVGFVAGSITHRVAITDAAGKASLKLPQSITISTVFALSDQHGFDYRLFRPGRKSRGDRKQKPAGLPEGPVRLTLGDTGPLTIRILDADGNPIPEVDVYPWLLQKPGENDKFNVSIAGPMSKELFSSKTDMNGEAEFPWLPKWNDRTSFWPTLEGYVRHQQLYDREKHGDHFTFTLQKTVLISGTVKLPDGRVCADSEVIVRGDGRGMNDFQREVRTDSEGRYEIRVDPDMIYLVVAKFKSKDGSQFVSAKRDGFAVWPGKPKENLNLQLEPAARVFGKVTRKSGDGVSNQRIRLVLIATSANEAGIELPDPEEQNFHAAPSYWQYTETDSDGDFEFWVANGQYELIGSTQNSRSKFTVKNRKPIQFDFKMNRPEMGMFKGQVIDAETKKPVGHANINVAYRSYRVNSTRSSAMTDAKGRFEFERSLHPMVLFVTDEGRTKGGMIKVGADDKSTDVKISALSSATGVITSSATGTPVSGLKMHYGHRVEMGNGVFTRRFGGSVTTDENGEFVLKGLVVGKKYSATLRTLKNGRIPLVASFKPTDSTEIQLGEIMMQIPDELEK